jgi:hypothetical protein
MGILACRRALRFRAYFVNGVGYIVFVVFEFSALVMRFPLLHSARKQ